MYTDGLFRINSLLMAVVSTLGVRYSGNDAQPGTKEARSINHKTRTIVIRLPNKSSFVLNKLLRVENMNISFIQHLYGYLSRPVRQAA
jgi:hypothetical protein